MYCTSWTFYGTVTQALRSGWPIPPTFIGSILFFILAFSFMRKLHLLVQEHNATSIADLIASRLGRNSTLAATITAVAVIGIVTAFQQMAARGSGGLATVSGGIAEALVTTAIGLLVAIPAVFAFNFLQSWVDARAVEIAASSNEFLDLVARQAHRSEVRPAFPHPQVGARNLGAR